jgi:hypothetical protein
MKRVFLVIVACAFLGSLCAPCVTHAKKQGHPAGQASEVAKEQAAEKVDGAVKETKDVGKGKKGEAKAKDPKKQGKKKAGKKGATPATPAVPTPGTPGATPATPATPPDVKK